MDADRIRAQRQGDGATARIVVERGGEVAASIDVGPDTLEEAVESLARVRALMPAPIRETVVVPRHPAPRGAVHTALARLVEQDQRRSSDMRPDVQQRVRQHLACAFGRRSYAWHQREVARRDAMSVIIPRSLITLSSSSPSKV